MDECTGSNSFTHTTDLMVRAGMWTATGTEHYIMHTNDEARAKIPLMNE
jgi:hypothetical protein